MMSSEIEEYDSDPEVLKEHFEAEKYYQEHDARHYQRQGKNKESCRLNIPITDSTLMVSNPTAVFDLLFQYGPESFRVFDEV